MPFDGTIDLAVPDIADRLDDLRRRQIPFATSLAINWTTRDAQQAIRAELGRAFTIRNKFLAGGIRTGRATKRSLEGRVFTLDQTLADHIEGTTRKGRITTPPRHAPRPNARGIYRKRALPAAQLKLKRTFAATLRTGQRAVFRRKGKTRYPIELLWWLGENQAQIDPDFDFAGIGIRTFLQRWKPNFGRALAKAIATAK